MASIWDGIGLQNQVQNAVQPTIQTRPKAPIATTGYPAAPTPTPVTMSGTTVPASPTNAQATPAAPGTFNASNNLINRQFTSAPTTSPQFRAVSGPDYSSVQSILSGLTGGAGGRFGAPTPAPTFTPNADTQKVRELTMQSLEGALQGPDRAKLAGDAYGLLEERSRPEFEQRVRQLGQKTAALGRVGSGIYGSNLTDLNTEREQELGFNRRELANSAAGQSLQDKLAQLDAARGVGSDFFGQDAERGRIAAQSAGSAAGAWNNNMDRLFDVARFQADLSDRTYGADVRERDTEYGAGRDQYGDAVNERGYQYGLERDAQDDRYRSRGFEEDLIDRQFDRDIRGRSFEEDLYNNQFNRGAQLYGLGKDKNLYNNLINQTNRYDKQSSEAGDAFADSMAGYGLRRQGTPTPTRSPSDDFYRTTGAYPEEALNIPTPDYRSTRY